MNYTRVLSQKEHTSPRLEVAVAAKAIENVQGDFNISYVNELALIFDCMGIDTNDILD
jgi:UDP-N-acetyl-D-galactosamine dehydrogenase